MFSTQACLGVLFLRDEVEEQLTISVAVVIIHGHKIHGSLPYSHKQRALIRMTPIVRSATGFSAGVYGDDVIT